MLCQQVDSAASESDVAVFNIRYVSTSVSQSNDLPCCGTFLLHQGIQRRVALTIIQDGRTDLQWTDVHALTVGCVRNTREQKMVEGDRGILSLNAIVVPCTRQREDTRYPQRNSIAAIFHVKPFSFYALTLSFWRQEQHAASKILVPFISI